MFSAFAFSTHIIQVQIQRRKEFKNEPEVLRLSKGNETASNLILSLKTSFKGVSVLGKIGSNLTSWVESYGQVQGNGLKRHSLLTPSEIN